MDTVERTLHACKASRGLPNIKHSAALFPVTPSSHQTDVCSNKQAVAPDDQNRFESHEHGIFEKKKGQRCTTIDDELDICDRSLPTKVALDHENGTIDVQEMNNSRKASSAFQ